MRSEANRWVSSRLRELRSSRKLTQAAAAEKLGMNLRAYQAWEEGRAVPNVFQSQAIAELYSITLDQLYKGCPREVKPPRHNKLKTNEISMA